MEKYWIDVNEQLPEDQLEPWQRKERRSIPCIVTNGVRTFLAVRTRVSEGKDSAWMWNHLRITHWMPLPDPVKREKNEKTNN